MGPELRKIWRDFCEADLPALRSVIRVCDQQMKRRDLAEQAEVHEHDIRNFLSVRSPVPHARLGLRLLIFAASQPAEKLVHVRDDHARLMEVTKKIPPDVDDDYFFRYLDRIGLLNGRTSRTTAELMQGNYYLYRLSGDEGLGYRSHIEVRKYDPFDRVTHFTSRLRHGRLGTGAGRTYCSEGQILEINSAYVLVGFVFEKNPTKRSVPQDYKGFKLGVFSVAQFQPELTKPASGFFACYNYGNNRRYEYGPALITSTEEEFDATKIGLFDVKDVSHLDHNITSGDLQLSVPGKINSDQTLMTCLIQNIFVK